MRIAVIGDVHGNLIAFEAVLAHARAQTPDLIVQIGDYVVGHPDSRQCYALARSVGGPMLRGNHEGYLLDAQKGALDPERFAPVRWSRAQFDAGDFAHMRALPLTHALGDDALFMHAAPADDRFPVHAHTTVEALAPHFGARAETLFVRGHNHMANERRFGGKRIITIGSAGLPLDGYPEARYLLLDRAPDGWHASHMAVPYDRRRALQRFLDSGWLRDTGVIGKLYFDEARTGTHLINKSFWNLIDRGVPLAEAYRLHMGYDVTHEPPMHAGL